MTQLYVGNLSAEGDEKAIRALFGKYGQVREVLMKNGYAFVEFDSPIAAEDAMRELNGKWCYIITSPKRSLFWVLRRGGSIQLCTN